MHKFWYIDFLSWYFAKSMVSLGFSIVTALLFPFQFEHFYFFSCQITLARIPHTVWNKSGKVGILILSPILQQKVSFSPLSMMLVVDLSYMTFAMLRHSLCTHFLTFFLIINWCWIFVKCFFCIFLDYHIFLFFVKLVYNVDWLTYIEPSLYPWNEFQLIMVYNRLNVLLNSVFYYFVEEVYLYAYQEYWSVILFSCCPYIVSVSR